MAPIGTITTSLNVDDKKYRGSNDPITGNVALTFHASEASAEKKEIFGPLQLAVVLRCHVKLMVRENRTSHAYILYDEKRQISEQRVQLHDGPFRAPVGQSHTFPFEIFFPRDAVSQGRRVPLPPSLHIRIQSVAVRQFGKHQGQAWAEHHVSVEADMPSIDVKIARAQDSTIVQYEQGSTATPRSTAKRDLSQKLEVQTYELLPRGERPSGLLEKTKAVIKSSPKPTFSFEATCVGIPEAICIGQSITFAVRTDTHASSLTPTPEFGLSGGTIELIAVSKLYATNEKGVESPRLENSSTVATLAVRALTSSTVFTKAEDFTKNLATDSIPTNIPASFSIVKFQRQYRMRVELQFLVAGRTAVMEQEMEVQLLPAGLSPPTEAGPSRSVAAVEGELDDLPTYETAVTADEAPPTWAGSVSPT